MATPKYKLAKVVGWFVIMASAVSQEYGAGINAVSTQSIGTYPGVGNLVPLIMFITGLLLIPKVFMFQRFGGVASRSGGEYVWISRTISPEVGFIIHFLYWAGVVSAMGFIGYTAGSTLASTLVSLGITSGAWFATFAGHMVFGLALIWLFFLIHYSGVKSYGALVVILFALIIFAAAISMFVGFTTSNATYTVALSNQIFKGPIPSYTTPPLTYTSFFGTITLFVFAYGGLSAAPLLGGEAKNPEKDMPRGIIMAWVVALALFTLVSLAIFHVITGPQVYALINSKKSYYATLPGILSIAEPPILGAIFTLVVTVIIAKTIAPEMLGASRSLFAWGEDLILPQIFTHTNRFKAPDFSLFISAVIASLYLVYTTYVGVSTVDIRALSVLFVILFLGIGVLLTRAKKNKKEWETKVSTAAMVVAAIAGIIITLIIVPSVFIIPHVNIWLQPSFQILLAVVLALIIYEVARVYRRSKGINLTELIKSNLPLE